MERGKVAFSLAKPKAPAAPKAAPRAFDADDEEDAPQPSTRAPAPLSKAARRQQEEAEKVDASAFDYDGVYDKMKAVEQQLKAANKEADKGRKSKYMSSFMHAAEIRERDRLRAESKMIQREREAEGDAYAGKEAFVTSAYKEQQEELRRAEEEERVVEARERQKNRGVASFHQRMLKDESEKRQAALEALANDDIHVEEKPEEVSDKERAAQAAQQGRHVELNEDNQIVDKRELLSTGLNVLKRKEPEEKEEEQQPASSRAKRSQLMEEELLAKLMGDS
ncbi:uncharacterized protein MJAP1_003007 [Malassezia japonica]|uniref:Nuclear speckle splicing regulatory protein 1 N-terminal domain-containing protein n=1 Tax=Malassezia japonica TaxID=223818 RepID=A0AAF0F3B0_9BASI|nr:uncharacterized protein MJAP1_003007 [Malassezia japonica]WFD40025.1 hypothetical protein MJAP1_003007 [Malassezia japonica]